MRSAESISKKPPLKVVLVAPFIALIFLTACLAAYLSFRNGQKAVNDVANKLREETTRRIEDHLRDFLKTPWQINEVNATAMGRGMLDFEDPEAMEKFFWHQVGIFDSVTSIYFGNPRGGLVNSGREGAGGTRYVIATEGFEKGPFEKYAVDESGNRTRLLVTVPDFDCRTRPWYAGAVENKGAFWSDVYVLFTGQDIAISASRPVYDGNRGLSGVVAVDIFLSHLNSFLKTIDVSENSLSFIMEPSGLLIASSAGEPLFRTSSNGDKHERIGLEESSVPLLREASSQLTRKFGGCDRISSKQYLEFDLDGVRQFLHVSPFHDPHGLDWLIVTAIPESDFLGRIYVNRRITILLIACTLILTGALGAILSDWITSPVYKLNDAAKEMAKGNWELGIEASPWIREIAELTRSFERMGRQLKATVTGLSDEIAEREKAEQLLRAKSEELDSYFSHSLDLLCIADKDGIFRRLNREWRRALGYPPQELEGKPFMDFIHPDDVTATLEAAESLAENRRVENFANRYRHCDGTYRWLEWRAYRRDDLIYAVARDITDRLEAEKNLKRQRELLQTVIDNIPVLITLYDPSMKFALVNRAFEKTVGWNNKDLERIDLMEQCYPDPKVRAKATAYMQKASTEWHEFAVTAKSGGRIQSIWSNVGVDDIRIGIGIDITERKKLEARLGHAQKMESVGVLAGGIAHEFNNILGIVIGNTELAMLDASAVGTVRENLQAIQMASERARDVVRQLLTFSRKVEKNKAPALVAPMIKEAVRLLRSSIPSNIRIDLQIEDKDLVVEANATHIHQLMINLCGNAADAMMERGGKISIRVSGENHCRVAGKENPSMQPGRYVLIEVADTGEGMEKEVLDRIFEPYFTTKEVGKGTGMGLAICHGIVEQHHGTIAVESEPGHGTVFRISLPAEKKKVVAEPKPLSTVPLGSERILFVDDEAPLVQIARTLLESLGYRVAGHVDPVGALDAFKEDPQAFDLVVTDMAMPGMTGEELVKQIAGLRPDLPVVLCTGFSSRMDRERAEQLGIRKFLRKPLEMKEFAKVVRKILDDEKDRSRLG